MSRDVMECKGCTLSAKHEPPVPMLRSTLPEAPWDKLAIDFNGPHSACGGKLIVVLVDYFSRYLFAQFVKSTDFTSLKTFLDKIFARYGLSKTIRFDNGPPFNGADYSIYLKSLGIVPEFSTPGFPQQNGLVERYMQLVNKSITIAVAMGQNCNRSLAETIAAHNSAIHRITGNAPSRCHRNYL
jgi:transposase InsO family protein